MKRLSLLTVLTAVFCCSPMPANADTHITDNQGIQYQLPTGWQAKKLNRGIQMYPPQATNNEMYIAMRYDWTFTKNDRDKLHRLFDGMTKKLSPHLNRTGDRWFNGPNGPVVVLFYVGTNPNGEQLTAIYQFANMGQHSFLMLTAAKTDVLKSRFTGIKSIFLSVVNPRQQPHGGHNVGQSGPNNPPPQIGNGGQPNQPVPNINRQLVGRWVRRAKSNGNTNVGHGSSKTYTFTFQADGTFTLNVVSSANVTTVGTAGSPASGQGKTYQGRWRTSNGQLILTFPSGKSLTVNYNVFSYQGRPALKVVMPGKNPAYYLKVSPSSGNGSPNSNNGFTF